MKHHRNITRLLFFFTTTMMSCSVLVAQYNPQANGTWASMGYGWVATINSQSLEIFDVTSISCTPTVSLPMEKLAGHITVSGDVLVLERGITLYTFNRISKLPDLCTKRPSEEELKSPVHNFEVLWHTFNDNYAYFKERNVDWQNAYKKYRPQITSKTKPEALFLILKEMLEAFGDGHVDIEADERLMKKALTKEVFESIADPDFKSIRQAIVAKYLNEHSTHNLSKTVWGHINEKVGYVQVNSMDTQGYYGITENMTSKQAVKSYYKYVASGEDQLENEVSGMHKTMLKIWNDLGETNHLILDLRFNGGGEDAVGLAILSYFIETPRTVFTKKERNGNGFGPERPTILTAAPKHFKGKLYILQSHWSASATEVLLLASLTMENVERIGSPSEGIFSDILTKKLPNGWKFGLSNQVYQDNSGVGYEAIGIPVHVDLQYPKDEDDFIQKLESDLRLDGDTAIQYILGLN